jgi:L-seryl-tRNA(Ser) seleniumtransferase
MSSRRLVPSIDRLRQRPVVRALEAQFGVEATLEALRDGADQARRAAVAEGAAFEDEEGAARQIEDAARRRLDETFRRSLQPVINATGVIVHTNLGRAPLAEPALERLVEVARGYCALEYDVERGGRGRRDVHAERSLCRLTGAATLLVLAALAAGREVVVSRGELVEIGGGFRVPDVMAQSGALLREVGTTNKTRTADYAAAVGDRTALILRVHPSNFRIEGFTERPPLEELVALGRRLHVPVLEDLGSGHLLNTADHPLAASEPSVQASIAAGVDVCCFSGDKLLGGPQAGVIVGSAALVERVRRHPLMRALRVDKLTYAALDATLAEYVAGRAATTVPVQRMLGTSAADVRVRAERLAERLAARPGWRATLVPGMSAVGGGGAPGVELPTWLVAVERGDFTADALAARLRGLHPPVIARIEHDRLVLDLRTVAPSEDARLAGLLSAI